MGISMRKLYKKRKIICIIGLCAIVTCVSFSIYHVRAEEDIKQVTATFYSVEEAGLYTAPDEKLEPIILLPGNAPIKVTGMTANGWFQIELNGTYYVKQDGLKSALGYSEEDIQKMTRGSYSFYSTRELGELSKSDVMDMDENTYLRYLDSFLRGNGAMSKCIMLDTGLTLSEYIAGKKEVNPIYATKTEKEILVEYRLNYLKSALEGPFRTSKALYLSMTRAIRYEKAQYTVKWKNASIGDDQAKMEAIIAENVERIQKEQGVTFSYSLSYEDECWNIKFQIN